MPVAGHIWSDFNFSISCSSSCNQSWSAMPLKTQLSRTDSVSSKQSSLNSLATTYLPLLELIIWWFATRDTVRTGTHPTTHSLPGGRVVSFRDSSSLVFGVQVSWCGESIKCLGDDGHRTWVEEALLSALKIFFISHPPSKLAVFIYNLYALIWCRILLRGFHLLFMFGGLLIEP